MPSCIEPPRGIAIEETAHLSLLMHRCICLRSFALLKLRTKQGIRAFPPDAGYRYRNREEGANTFRASQSRCTSSCVPSDPSSGLVKHVGGRTWNKRQRREPPHFGLADCGSQ